MAQTSMVGSRIRERRVLSGLKQSELARRAGISASYLNLIEHNRRSIGGKTLLTLAELLEVEPALLSEGAEATLIAGLRESAGTDDRSDAELDRIEEFAGRFPGWARLLVELSRRAETLEQSVQTLTDRLAHDPHLADSLHEVISTVTAIRSTASILVDTKELEPEWRARFHRNINEDSGRLAEGAEALVRYLEGAPDTEAEIRSPQDELHAFLSEHGFHFPALEKASTVDTLDQLVTSSEALSSEAGRSLARSFLEHYAHDATLLSLEMLTEAIRTHGLVPGLLLEALPVGPSCLFRRLASLPAEDVGPIGLLICDGSGTLLLRKPLPGFTLPSAAAGCTLWPLYQVLSQPQQPIGVRLRQAGNDQSAVMSYAVAEQVSPAGFDHPPQVHAHMLLLPDLLTGEESPPARSVGATCRICQQDGCTARREPSIIAKGF